MPRETLLALERDWQGIGELMTTLSRLELSQDGFREAANQIGSALRLGSEPRVVPAVRAWQAGAPPGVEPMLLNSLRSVLAFYEFQQKD